jgi:hypothetical protein
MSTVSPTIEYDHFVLEQIWSQKANDNTNPISFSTEQAVCWNSLKEITFSDW